MLSYQTVIYVVNTVNKLTLSSELMNKLGLPVEHDVLLVFNRFFLYNTNRRYATWPL